MPWSSPLFHSSHFTRLAELAGVQVSRIAFTQDVNELVFALVHNWQGVPESWAVETSGPNGASPASFREELLWHFVVAVRKWSDEYLPVSVDDRRL